MARVCFAAALASAVCSELHLARAFEDGARAKQLPRFSVRHSGQALPAHAVDSIELVSGLCSAFMHKLELSPGEKTCLVNNLGQLSLDVIDTGQNVVAATKALMQGNRGNEAPAETASNVMSSSYQGTVKMPVLISSAAQFIKNCVQDSFLQMLKRAGQLFINVRYLDRRFFVDGVDTGRSLADSIRHFEAKDFRRFGADIGTALRKILLAHYASNGRVALPEGVPEQNVIKQVTAGLMTGFFVQGSLVEITDSKDSDAVTQLDLRECIDSHKEFFNAIMLGMWSLFARLAATKPLHDRASAWPSVAFDLKRTLMQLPAALQRCGLGTQSQRMFMEAIQSLDDDGVTSGLLNNRLETLPTLDKMAKAIEAWNEWNFGTFGKELGMLLRNVVLLKWLQGKEHAPRKGDVPRHEVVGYSLQTRVFIHGKQLGPISVPVASGCILGFVVALAAARSIRRPRHEDGNSASMEQGTQDLEDLE